MIPKVDTKDNENHLDNFKPLMSIGTVAQQLDVSIQTIRMYEAQGLIIPFRTQSGRRMFSLNDLNRLDCIRKMIRDHGLNIQGIKHLLSFIPCWEYKGGLDEECRQCPAYTGAQTPCWTLEDVGDKCRNTDCRDCEVYLLELNCNTLKNIILKK